MATAPLFEDAGLTRFYTPKSRSALNREIERLKTTGLGAWRLSIHSAAIVLCAVTLVTCLERQRPSSCTLTALNCRNPAEQSRPTHGARL